MNIYICDKNTLCLAIRREAWASCWPRYFQKHPARSAMVWVAFRVSFASKGHVRLDLWACGSCCVLGWAGAAQCPWPWADMDFGANSLVQLK